MVAPASTTSLTLPSVPEWGPFERTFVGVYLLETPRVATSREFRQQVFRMTRHIPGIELVAGTYRESLQHLWF